MTDKDEEIIVVAGVKKNSVDPVYIPKTEDTSDAVVIKFKSGDKKSGFHVDVPDGTLSNVVLSSMPETIGAYLTTKGLRMREDDLKVLVASMTTRLIYIPSENVPDWVRAVASYFTENVYQASVPNDSQILKCVYAACRNPERIHILLLNLKKGFYFPDFLTEYINTPSSGVEMVMNEYINDVYIGKAKIPDNLYVIATGDMEVIPESIERQYAIWNPKASSMEEHLAFYSVMGMNSIKNMYRIFEPVPDRLWNKMGVLEDILSAMGFHLTNKDSNHLDDYLVTLVNEKIPGDKAFDLMVNLRLIPMVRKEIDADELKSRIRDAGILEEGE